MLENNYPYKVEGTDGQNLALELWINFNFQIIDDYTNDKEKQKQYKVIFLKKAQEAGFSIKLPD